MLEANFKDSLVSKFCSQWQMSISSLYNLSWDHLTHKNFELERLCMDLRSEIEVLQHQAKLR